MVRTWVLTEYRTWSYNFGWILNKTLITSVLLFPMSEGKYLQFLCYLISTNV